jgi:hypothetical protein
VQLSKNKSSSHKQLKELEEIAEESIKHNHIASEIWKAGVETLLKVSSEDFPWITDVQLRLFFEKEVKAYKPEERLSSSAGNGFY